MIKAKEAESQIAKKEGWESKSMCQGILSVILEPNNICMSTYHGGDIEGTCLRRLMGNCVAIFEDISEYFRNYFQTSNQQDQMENNHFANNEEIKKVCDSYGSLFLLLDGVFSDLNVSRHNFEESLIPKLES